MNHNARISLLALIAALVACGAQRPEVNTIPPDGRDHWARCEAEVDRWCIDHSHGSGSHERECMNAEMQRYAALTDDASRSAYLRSHGCVH